MKSGVIWIGALNGLGTLLTLLAVTMLDFDSTMMQFIAVYKSLLLCTFILSAFLRKPVIRMILLVQYTFEFIIVAVFAGIFILTDHSKDIYNVCDALGRSETNNDFNISEWHLRCE